MSKTTESTKNLFDLGNGQMYTPEVEQGIGEYFSIFLGVNGDIEDCERYKSTLFRVALTAARALHRVKFEECADEDTSLHELDFDNIERMHEFFDNAVCILKKRTNEVNNNIPHRA